MDRTAALLAAIGIGMLFCATWQVEGMPLTRAEYQRIVLDISSSKKMNYYDQYQIGRSATEVEIKQAFRTLSQKHHPDVSSNEDHSSISGSSLTYDQIRFIRDILTDKQKRREYDQLLAEPQRPNHQYSSYVWTNIKRAPTIREIPIEYIVYSPLILLTALWHLYFMIILNNWSTFLLIYLVMSIRAWWNRKPNSTFAYTQFLCLKEIVFFPTYLMMFACKLFCYVFGGLALGFLILAIFYLVRY